MNLEQQLAWDTLSDHGFTYYQKASPEERRIMREWVQGILRERTVQITFVKADGTERTMPCTLNESQLPPRPVTENTRARSEEVCAVWDPEREVWRSFRWDRVRRIEFTLG